LGLKQIADENSRQAPNTMTILPAYASMLAFLFVYLSIRTIRARRSLGIGLGHEENPVMLRAMRVHANFAEYVPFALLLVFLVESSAARPLLVHALGATLVVARLSHAFGVSREPENYRFRVFGMALTFTVILVSAIYVLAIAVTR
jgi:uncharacterized membrane protein YecN with MAPEG domain